MAVTSDVKRGGRLVDGRFMTCPRCRKKQDILAFIPMETIEEFRHELNPIYKCKICRWVFSPALTIEELKMMFGIFESEVADE